MPWQSTAGNGGSYNANQPIAGDPYYQPGQINQYGPPGTVPSMQQEQLNNYSGLNPNIRPNPVTNAAQMAALGQYGNLVSGGGNDTQSNAMLAQANQQNKVAQQGQQGALLMQQKQQGGVNPAMAYAAGESAAQGGNNAAAMGGTQAAADAATRLALATGQYGNLAGNINNQQFQQGQQNFQNAFNLAGSENNVISGQQNYITNQQNANAAALGQNIGLGTQFLGGAYGYLSQPNQQNPYYNNGGYGGQYGNENPNGWGAYPGGGYD